MASAQVAHDHQAAFDELVKQAQSAAVGREVINPQDQVFLTGHLRNLTSGSMNLYKPKVWSGHLIRQFPATLTVNATAGFEQVSRLAGGIKSAVVYEGRNVEGQIPCGWLVAWSNPEDIQAKKVYVDCGEIEKFHNIDWEMIKEKLSKSTSRAEHTDPRTGTTVRARLLPPLKSATFAAGDGILVAEFSG